MKKYIKPNLNIEKLEIKNSGFVRSYSSFTANFS